MSEERSGGGRQAIIAQYKKAAAQTEEPQAKKEEPEPGFSVATHLQEEDDLLRSCSAPPPGLDKVKTPS